MRLHDWCCAGVVGLFVGGCAGMQSGTSPETKAALAPAGKLRVAFLSPAPLYAAKGPTTGEVKGVAVDLGKELSRRVGVPFEPVGYAAVPALIGGAKAGEWDVALMGINAERATAMDFSAPYIEVEQGYLVRALKNAVLVRTANPAELYALFAAGKVGVIAATKTALFAEAGKQPGSRVLDGRILSEPIGMGVPKGRDPAAAAYVRKFIEAAKAEGLVKSAIERAGLRGVVVAPLR